MDSSDGNHTNVPNDSRNSLSESTSESTASTTASVVDSKDTLFSQEQDLQTSDKHARFLLKETRTDKSRSRPPIVKQSLPEKNPFTEVSTNLYSGKFSCCPVTNPDDPIEDPFSLPCTTKVENSSSLPLQRKPKIYAPPVKPPSSFVSLNKYGYEVKYPGSLLKLNISGTVFIVKISTLQKDQIVFEKILETAEYIPETDEYYLERDPVVFRFVHNYLRHQEMHLPLNICGPLLEKELEAWGLQLGFDLQRCCLGPVMDTKSKMESLRKFEETFSESLSDKEFNAHLSIRWQKLRQYVWRIITDTPKKRWLGSLQNNTPATRNSTTNADTERGQFGLNRFNDSETSHTSGVARGRLDCASVNDTGGDVGSGGDDGLDNSQNSESRLTNKPFNWRTLQKTPKEITLSRVYVASQFLIVASLINYMTIAYIPELREPFGPALNITHDNANRSILNGFPVHRSYREFNDETCQATRPVLPLRVLTWICVVLFTIDLIARAIFCPNLFRWLRSFYTITDIVSLLPFYVEGIILAYVGALTSSESTNALANSLFFTIDIFNMFKVFVVVRIFRLLQRQRATRVLIYTIRTAATNIVMVFELILLCAIFFGTSIFYFDLQINSILTGIWWAFTTMTTVGYGDVIPSSVPGRLIAVLCMIIGILLTSYTIPVLVNDFLLFYGHADQLAWMRRIHKSATAKRRTEKRDLMAKRQIKQVRTLIRQAVIGLGTFHEGSTMPKASSVSEYTLRRPDA
ncbi:Potassium voltage-gated channel protein egl-36 [Echinococcus granulosus]|uniref:Potassium voltage gated channel subfamily D n=1 Tax=Echinococcus granulosus TaxID=6210 RepID=A0A068X0W3_ECHGR|nr:Potassium voltage-gated channel protein egl-36 [Echinococcus granulosus]CDS23564.1 potassium voltage gated channel subfamily D [Echinococcus granulosus]